MSDIVIKLGVITAKMFLFKFLVAIFWCMCSKYGFGTVMSEGIIYLRLRIILLVGMSWADVLARGVMCDVRHPRQEEAL